MHPRGPIFQQRASRPRFVVDLGHWELSLIKDGARKAWLVFLSFFIYFARLVAIIGGSNSNNCRRYRFKKF